MKSLLVSRWVSYAVLLLAGIIAGMFLQKYLGLGNILRAVGIPYPTSTAPVPATVLPAEIPMDYQGRMHLFILAGQSNMVGWGAIPEGEQTDPRIFVFGKDYHWHLAEHPIENPANQVDMVSKNGIAGFGPAMDFAFASLERHPDIVIGLIPCARNSSGIIEWQRDLSDQTLYGSCLKRVRAASPMGKIAGLLYFQGESDAMDPNVSPTPEPHASDWSMLFVAFINNFRTDLQRPDLPVVYAQLGPKIVPEAVPNWDSIKAQQAALQLPAATMITTDDLPLMDELHFTTDSYRVIGTRFADAYWDLVEKMEPE